eukprot:CAMPEP_0183306880 /NCGR_PEP_ID=MMETSP0160_2-20130417/15274_1 /TAXON_ID=2839 ORGANISM="Odontella Sinensis, Strain Grunow 1884" /NCGR_SAMPLE_ID=MMETSP0160_2 /ASSEMBLY_ACC=CAM_ASM_000250 /LENGTH=271 /DNA_ID=CAMNT_0025470357 /DNA_START=71 /DNA_END=886 /DNA_ORIENTATION=-
MFELSWSVVAWLAVVIFQAVIHFGVIGPRRRRQREKLEQDQRRIEAEMEESDRNLSNLSTLSTADDYYAQAAKMATAAAEEETERDTYDVAARSSLDKSDYPPFYAGPRERKPHLERKYGGDSTGSGPLRDINPAEDHSAGEHEDIDDIDEDESWRYELVRYYYSERSPHVIQLDRFRQHEHYDSEKEELDKEAKDDSKTNQQENIYNKVLLSLARTIEDVANTHGKTGKTTQGLLRRRHTVGGGVNETKHVGFSPSSFSFRAANSAVKCA